jgi:predicted permease
VPEVVLSHRFWQRRLQGAPDIIGKTIWLSGTAFTVVGVMPPAFKGTFATTIFVPELWVPLGTVPQIEGSSPAQFDDRTNRSLTLLGRVKPAIGLAQAQAGFDTLAARLARGYPQSNDGVSVFVFKELDTHPEVYSARALNLAALLFLALSALVLAVACANLASLMLARAEGRRKEIALRLAMGASRGQLVRQLVTEAMVLSLLAGAVGLAAGLAVSHAISTVRLPTDLPIAFDVAIDVRVFLFTVGISLLAGVAFGLVPALGASRPALVPALKGAGWMSSRRRRITLSGALTVAQVAFSLVLLVAAGLFWRSIAGASTIDPGMQVANRTLVSFSPSLLRYDSARTTTFYRTLLERVSQSPEVESAALAAWLPLGFAVEESSFFVQGAATRPSQDATRSWVNVVTPRFFESTGLRLRAGRTFGEQDKADTLPVAMVNETLARQAWPGQNPIGRQLRASTPDAPWLTVVGVVADGKYRTLTEAPSPYLLRPLSQVPTESLTLVTKNAHDHAGALSAIRREVQKLDPDMPLLEARTMEQQMAKVRFVPQAMTALAGPVAGLAMLIASIGLYGVIAGSVSRRTREFGIRIAIGAGPRDVVRQVMSQALGIVGTGLGLGAVAALAVARVAKGLLLGVAPTDPAVFVCAMGMLVAVALVASYLPARRASRVDPVVALRQE